MLGSSIKEFFLIENYISKEVIAYNIHIVNFLSIYFPIYPSAMFN